MNICKKKYYHWFKRKFTVACDLSPFTHESNEREYLFHRNGIFSARRTCRKWVGKHPWGQARIIYGHKKWEDGCFYNMGKENIN